MARLMGFDKLSPHMRPKPVKGHGRWASTKGHGRWAATNPACTCALSLSNGTADGLRQAQPAYAPQARQRARPMGFDKRARPMGCHKPSLHMCPEPVKWHGRWASTKGTADGLPQTQPAHVT